MKIVTDTSSLFSPAEGREQGLIVVPVGVRRSWGTAVETILRRLQTHGTGENWLISVCHAGTPERAETVRAQIAEQFGTAEIEVLELSAALTTHGGPGCIVVQAIKK